MNLKDLKDYYEVTRDDNEKSFTKWCEDHEWYKKDDGLWYCLADEED